MDDVVVVFFVTLLQSLQNIHLYESLSMKPEKTWGTSCFVSLSKLCSPPFVAYNFESDEFVMFVVKSTDDLPEAAFSKSVKQFVAEQHLVPCYLEQQVSRWLILLLGLQRLKYALIWTCLKHNHF